MSYTDFDFPHTSLYTTDLRELIANMRRLEDIVKTFVNTEQVKFANPIIWNITTQYAKTTIVLDTAGNAYLSKQAVPSGIQLNNEEYWQEIFNFTDYTRTANQNLTVNVETNTTRATNAYNVDDWLIWNDVLYKVTNTIAIDDTLMIDTNIVHFTVEDFIKAFMTWATNTIQQYKNDIDASELQYKNDIDASESAYRAQLAQDIAGTTANLEAQLQAAISGATVDSEVINARVAWDNTIYNTLRDAIVAQILNCIHGMKQWKSDGHGYIITDLNEADDNSIYFFSPGPADWQNLQNFPVNNSGTLLTFSVGASGVHGITQLYFTFNGKIYSRFKFTSTNDWTSWRRIVTNNDIENAIIGKGVWSSDGHGYIITDLNEADANSVYFFSPVPADWQNMQNFPVNSPGTLLTFSVNNSGRFGITQLYFTFNGKIYSRFKFTNDYDWTSWRRIITDNDIENAIIGKGEWKSDDHGYIITDLNEADDNSIYFFSPEPADWQNLQNFPVSSPGTLLTFSVGASGVHGITQLYFAFNGKIYSRFKFTSAYDWTPWQKVNTHEEVHIVKTATNSYENEFTNLKEGIDFATAKLDSVVYIHEGTWNILDELGQDYIDGVSASQKGIVLKNRVHIICLPGAHFVCNYTGNNQNVITYLSIFNSGIYGFTLENADMVGSNIRYLIHDERGSDDDYYENKYFNCHMNINRKSCIGGGLGKHGQIVIDSCWFTSGNYPAYDPVFYHNTGAPSGASNITIKNCYFAGSTETFSLRWHGTSQEMTRAYVCNNSFGIAPEIRAELTTDTDVNTELIAYCNEIRN